MEKLKDLFVVCCSDTKNPYGERGYSDKKAAFNLIPEYRKALLHKRAEALKILSREVKKDPYNYRLTEGPDLNGDKTGGEYLAAYQRYKGRFYTQISENTWDTLKDNILIISSLYGVVHPQEPIQCYALSIDEHPEVLAMWKKDGGLTNYLAAFIRLHEIKRVWVLIGDTLYGQLIDWKRISDLAEVYFPEGEVHSYGSTLLPALGEFIEKFLYEEDLIQNLGGEKWFETSIERIKFTRKEPPPLNDDTEPPSPEARRALANIINVKLSEKALRSASSLPPDIRSKFIDSLFDLLRNPDSSGLRVKKIKTSSDMFRCRIDYCYRIHFRIEKEDLIIEEAGPHKLQGVD